MTDSSERLRRYIEDEIGDCRDEDVDRRLEELDDVESKIEPRLENELAVVSALANETRYVVVCALVGEGELCVCELDSLVDVSESALSHATRRLVEAGLVVEEKDGRWKKYRPTNRAVALVTVLEGSVAADG